jgi:hypothetical protein
MDLDIIKHKIYSIRGVKVMLDRDLAELYEVSTKRLNEQVKRNIERFPERYIFQLTASEYNSLRSQFATLNSGRGMHRKYLPYAFTEHGVSMLSSVLNSETAVKVSIQIIDAFISLRKLISRNADIFRRLDSIEVKQLKYDKNFDKIFDALETHKPKQGIFFNGQIFDAYEFISGLIRNSKKSIILIDNYVDDTILTLFTKRRKNVNVTIYTKSISKQLKLDLEKYNSQYDQIKIKEFRDSHDRFLIIDKEVYHFGASLKDLGKKWFAFSKFDKEVFRVLGKLKGFVG